MSDFQSEYFKSRDNQFGSSKVNNVIGNDIHCILLSLIREFSKIDVKNLVHNMEISQYYEINNLHNGYIIPDNSEIILKYIDTTVCLSNEKNCSCYRGLVRFYIKQKKGDEYKYVKINVIKICPTISKLEASIYQNSDKIQMWENIVNIAIAKGQKDAISKMSDKLILTTSEKIRNSVNKINEILFQIKKASTKSQISKLKKDNEILLSPSQTA